MGSIQDSFNETLTIVFPEVQIIQEADLTTDIRLYSLATNIELSIASVTGEYKHFINPSVWMLLTIKYPKVAGAILEGLLANQAINQSANEIVDAIAKSYEDIFERELV